VTTFIVSILKVLCLQRFKLNDDSEANTLKRFERLPLVTTNFGLERFILESIMYSIGILFLIQAGI
jgi:hypothetical protein